MSIGKSTLRQWFRKEGFRLVKFEGSYQYITAYWLQQSIYYKLSRKEGFDVFFKEAYGGSIIVFEVMAGKDKLHYNCYCPIFLFGLWTIKLPFVKSSPLIFKYRKEGYQIEERFKKFLSEHSS